jgi:tetratricopeptide (TPR) repeat protein
MTRRGPPSPVPARLLGASVLLPGLTAACMTALIAGAALITPASPLALGRADAMLGRGMPLEAVERYEAIAATSPFRGLRQAALRRAARVHELELDQPAEARAALKLLLATGVTAQEEGDVREQLGELYLTERETASAAHQYRLAWDADPTRPERLARSAELRAQAGELDRAQRLWERLAAETTDTDWQDRARLGLGQLALARGTPDQALGAFQAAARSPHEGTARAARLGLAACYERLGELDGALAELDQADLPWGVRERRRQALIQRQATREPGAAASRGRAAP